MLSPSCKPQAWVRLKCYFWESGKVYFVCLFYKGKESITTRMKKVRPGSFMSRCQQEGQHTKSLEKIKQANINLWSRRQKKPYPELIWTALKTMQWLPLDFGLSSNIIVETGKTGRGGRFFWGFCLFWFLYSHALAHIHMHKKKIYDWALILLKSKEISIKPFP